MSFSILAFPGFAITNTIRFFVLLMSEMWVSDNRSKEPEEQKESYSQVKRRRMLQFDTEAMDSSLSSEDLSSSFLKSNVCAGYLFSCMNFLSYYP